MDAARQRASAPATRCCRARRRPRTRSPSALVVGNAYCVRVKPVRANGVEAPVDVPRPERRRHRLGLPVRRPAGRRRVPAVLRQRGLPRRGRLPDAADRLDLDQHAAVHVEPDRRRRRLLRRGRHRPGDDARHRLRLDGGTRVLAAQVQRELAGLVPGLDHQLLLAGLPGQRHRTAPAPTASPARATAGRSSSRRSRRRWSRRLAARPSTARSPSSGCRCTARRSTRSAGVGRPELPDVRQPHPGDVASTYSTSYTSTRQQLQERARCTGGSQAIDAKGTALSWTAPESFTQTYDVPTFDDIDNPTQGSDTPVLQWNPVPGAVSYDVDMLCSVRAVVHRR